MTPGKLIKSAANVVKRNTEIALVVVGAVSPKLVARRRRSSWH